MAKFATNNTLVGTQQNLTSAYKTLQAIWASSTVAVHRFKIYEIELGADGTPADNEITYDVSRQTADGTATATIPNALDPADSACSALAKSNYTAEGAITAASSVLCLALNQRATIRWVAREGSELVAPATNLAGFACRAKSAAYTSTCIDTILFDEQ